MSSIRLATASCVRGFGALSNALTTSDGRWTDAIDHEALGDEFGRFRVWSGNLGALQKGHSSLDYRLRDSPLLSGNTLKFLKELEDNLNEAFAVVTGARLPYESQKVVDTSNEDEEDDDFFSDDDDTSSTSKTELDMRFGEIVDIIDNLYRLSVRIRTPTVRSRSLKAATYQRKDPETGVDILGIYAQYDYQHTRDLLSHLREHHGEGSQDGDDFLAARLSKSITLRRRHFMYWKRHRDKLAISTIPEESVVILEPTVERSGPVEQNVVHLNPDIAARQVQSQKTGKTLLSGTEATNHNQSLDNLDVKSVTSYAVTVRDIHGKGIELPPPPKSADGERDFECPYCYIICPARYGSGRPWRTHLLQDLQPYVCTYQHCEASEQLFRSRREWAEHEATHRKAWRCPEHLTAVYGSRAGLEDHLRQEHADTIPVSQLDAIINIGETSTVDVREKCPICLASADTKGMGDFQSHVANHLERFATFALPNGNEEDTDGASSAASRGRSGSSESQDVREMSLPGDDSDYGEGVDEPIVQDDQAVLSADSLRSLPDVSGDRLTTLLAQPHLEDQDEIEKPASQTPDSYIERTGAFKAYLVSLGAESVRFFRRYDWWRGDATFQDENIAAKALGSFDRDRFPNMKIRQGTNGFKNRLKFNGPNPGNADLQAPTRQSTNTQYETDEESEASTTYAQEETENKAPVLSLFEIPTLHDLYRSRKLLQRDQSFAPNDSYNRIISFCYHDLTRLKVDAIVNSANADLGKSKMATTLNNAIHEAAGPGLAEEVKFRGRIKPGETALTGGYLLPSAHIIHAARPTFQGAQHMTRLNTLTSCYHSALELALEQGFKSVAFPCIGTGGCGFPSRVAARIVLQETREFLDKHPDHPFERIVFAMNSALDDKAYMDFFPVFFPPTHGDLETARASLWSADRSALSTQVFETRAQVQKSVDELSMEFTPYVPDFPDEIFRELRGIDSSLTFMRSFLLGSKELKTSIEDSRLICSVVQTVCGSISKFSDLAKDGVGRGDIRHGAIWTDYNAHMKIAHGVDLVQFLAQCQIFAQHLAGILNGDKAETDEIAAVRQQLSNFKAKHKDQDNERIHNKLDEVLYTRTFQQETSSPKKDIVRLHQIPTVHHLYQQSQLKAKPTFARPSVLFNNTVCLVRVDITKLDVTIIVNSTNILFSGSGTLDRLVFKKGGAELLQECKSFGTCNEGDLKVTPGYLLPARYIFHVVPPDQYKKEGKDVLRKIYRDILYRAASMRATSIAIPSIGTGMLNYPRRDCTSIAMEEVKRYLETAEPTSTLESIVFVVYSSHDEFIYKSMLPVYFPPVSAERGTAVRPTTPEKVNTPSTPASESTSPPRRSLFGSIGNALRNMGSVRASTRSESMSSVQPSTTRPITATSRSIDSYEEKALIDFESHAQSCVICKDIGQVYPERRELCGTGQFLAQTVLWHMDMLSDQNVYRKPAQIKPSVRLEIPEDMFPHSLRMLSLAERNLREGVERPFVVGESLGEQDQALQSAASQDKTDIPTTERARAHIKVWSTTDNIWLPVFPGDCNLSIGAGKMDVYKAHVPSSMQKPLLSLEFAEMTGASKYDQQPGLIIGGSFRLTTDRDTAEKVDGRILLLSQDAAESQSLLAMLHRAHPALTASLEELDSVVTADGGIGSESGGSKAQTVHPSEADPSPAGPQSKSRFRALQSKIQDLSHVASRRRPNSSQTPSNVPQSPMADEVLAYLMDDVKSRPGSYIGQNTNAIASALQKSPIAISVALRGLAAQDLVHQTTDENTWVVSHPPQDIPVLGEETQRRREKVRSRWGSAELEQGDASNKDRHQANLERVLAGDMKEEELRRFADEAS